ncbi:ethanolamine ammonia-lyase subunit EutC [Bacillus sp. FJAT-22090]|uniref:ethanolamine ammonia-lyase subunit EutC n=1 Tax=Bacillus sp. FJAT-22090 TaxID=1581038 RepID=UPI00119C9212|nr:ethanolamine ammonia-lyase subunit EutC [Bacillus sp. FJAT-22090]
MNKADIVELVLKELKNRGETTKTTEETIYFSDEKEMGVPNPQNKEVIQKAQKITPARIGIGRAGTRMRTTSYLQFRIAHAAAQDAVLKDVDDEFIHNLGLPILTTKAADMKSYLMDLDAGRTLSEDSLEWLKAKGEKKKQVQLLVCDGLSSSAVVANITDILPALIQGLELKNISVAKPLFVRRARVWVQDQIAQLVDCDLIVSLIGERPGLNTDESLSAYIIYRPNEQTVEADRTVISNIHRGGLTPVEAGAHLSEIIEEMLTLKCTGVKFAQREGSIK